jgi:hypothetical protein
VARHVRKWSGIPNAEVASDAALLRRALLALRPGVGERPRVRWALVSEALTHGSGVSHAVCVALGIDPDEQVAAPATPEWLLEAFPELAEEAP